MKKLFVFAVGVLTVLVFSCGGDERDNSIEASCLKQCEKRSDCYEDSDVDDCTDKCAASWKDQIDSEDVSDSKECKDAFADWAECMASLVCDDYKKESGNCEEGDYECQCFDRLVFLNNVCPVK